MHVALPKSRNEKLSPGEQRLGFLAANRDASLGYVGGYLLTTARGRPLEFHYSTPVKPSPTHRILYGTELEPYILGELIGANLIKQSTIDVAFIITDQACLLNQRKGSACPIVYAVPRIIAAGDEPVVESQPPTLLSHADYPDDTAALESWLQQANPGFDVREPFARVWEALREVLGAEAKSQAA
jgi:hypothetical protein